MARHDNEVVIFQATCHILTNELRENNKEAKLTWDKNAGALFVKREITFLQVNRNTTEFFTYYEAGARRTTAHMVYSKIRLYCVSRLKTLQCLQTFICSVSPKLLSYAL